MRLDIKCKHKYSTGFSLDIDLACEVKAMALFGPSGSGKTSLMSAISGSLVPDLARIRIDNQSIIDTEMRLCLPPEKRLVGITPQHSLLFDHLSVMANLRFGMPLYRKWKKQYAVPGQREILFDDVVSVLELQPLLARLPAGLSGGERQRVAIGRALLSQPRLLILDEPLSALDEALKAKIIHYLQRVIDHWQIPTIIITHSRTVVHKLTDFVVIINNGRIIDTGSPKAILPESASTWPGYQTMPCSA